MYSNWLLLLTGHAQNNNNKEIVDNLIMKYEIEYLCDGAMIFSLAYPENDIYI